MQLPIDLRYDPVRDAVVDNVTAYTIHKAKDRNYRYIRYKGQQIALKHIINNKAQQAQLDALLTPEGWEALARNPYQLPPHFGDIEHLF